MPTFRRLKSWQTVMCDEQREYRVNCFANMQSRSQTGALASLLHLLLSAECSQMAVADESALLFVPESERE